MATSKNTTTKKASASTEIVLGQAAQQIAKAVTELNAATSTVGQLVSQAEELTLQVANKESQIADLEVQYAEKARQAEVEFDLHSENKAVAAENSAKIGTLATQNKFLEEQVTKLYLQLDAERAAGIERAKAGSVGSINVSGQGK